MKYNLIRKKNKGILYTTPKTGDYICGKGYCEIINGILILGKIKV